MTGPLEKSKGCSSLWVWLVLCLPWGAPLPVKSLASLAAPTGHEALLT